MNATRPSSANRSAAVSQAPGTCQRGFSLIELMVAVTVGLFVALGLTMVFVSMKGSFVAQQRLADLQDSERLALTVLTTTLQSARYYPNVPTQTPAVALPPIPVVAGSQPAFGGGQGIAGFDGAAATDSDTVAVRYATAGGDGLMDCLGQTSTANRTIVAIFTVSAADGLTCSIDGGTTRVPIVPGVLRVKALYATNTVPTLPDDDGNADLYLNATAVDAGAHWLNVRNVRLKLFFANPFSADAGQPAEIEWTQVINLKSQP